MGSTTLAGVGASSILLLLLLLLPPVVQTQDSWGVDYHHRHICAVTGNTVNISATYWHPDWATVQAAHWLRVHRDHYWDVRLIPENLSRVIESCDNRNCILTIRDLRESDAAKYWLSCITDRGKYVNTKVPGVTLSLTDPRLKISVSRPIGDSGPTRLSCDSQCHLTSQPVYTWYKNNQEAGSERILYLHHIKAKDRFSCGLSGFRVHSPEVYAPKFTEVSLSPPGGLLEDEAVTLTCKNDANPAASVTWHKDNKLLREEIHTYFIRHFGSEHYGSYLCQAHNDLGTTQYQWYLEGNRTVISKVDIIRLSLPLSVLPLLLLLILWCRTNKKPPYRKKESTNCSLEMQPCVDSEAQLN